MTVERNASPLAVGQDAGFERDASRMRDDLSGSHARATQDSSVDPYADHGERLATEESEPYREWVCTSPMGWSTPGMGRPTTEEQARAQYAAEAARIRADPGALTYKARQILALQLRSRLVTEWQTEQA